MTYSLVPMKRDDARRFVRAVHRHLGAPVGDVLRVGLSLDGDLVGVAIAGRPVARELDDGRTLEVLRVAVQEGHACACSRLYGAIGRAATSLGYTRLVTYTRADEPGRSPLAAGFVRDGETRAAGWKRSEGGGLFPSTTMADPIAKVRWLRTLGAS